MLIVWNCVSIYVLGVKSLGAQVRGMY